MATQTHQIDNRLTALLVAFMNRDMDYIAERVSPRIRSGHAGQYTKFGVGTFFQKEATKMAYGARAKEIFTESELENFQLEYFGVTAPVDLAQHQDVLDDSEGMNDLLAAAMYAAQNTIMAEREEEVRDVFYDTANYPSGSQETLSNADKFDADDSNPLQTIIDALLVPIARPNYAVCGAKVWAALSTNGSINKAIHGNDGDRGVQKTGDVARVLGLNDIIVGNAFTHTADGSAPSGRIWDSQDYFALVRIETPMSLMAGHAAGFSVTASGMDAHTVTRWYDQERGPKGTELCRPMDHRKVLHISDQAGYLIKDCLS